MQYPVPVPPARRFIPAAEEVLERQGVTVAVWLRRGLFLWSVARTTGGTVDGSLSGWLPELQAGANLGHLLDAVFTAVRRLRTTAAETVFCATTDMRPGSSLEEALKSAGFAVCGQYPPPAGMTATDAELSRLLDALFTHVSISTDASRGRRSAWTGTGWVMDFGGGIPATTGSHAKRTGSVLEGELRAIRYGIQAAVARCPGVKDGTCRATVRSDSQLALRMLTEAGWEPPSSNLACRREVERILDLVRFADVEFAWVRGHNGDPANELADRLAVAARRTRESGLSPAEATLIQDAIGQDAVKALSRTAVVLAA